MTSTTNRLIPWQMRADLYEVPLTSEGRSTWGIKDPVSLEYFELGEEAHFVLKQLDGRRTIAEVCRRFQEHFRPRFVLPEELQYFIMQLIAQGLVVCERPGSGKIQSARALSARTQNRWAALLNLLSIRFRGIDPDRIFRHALFWFGWVFNPAVLIAGLLLIFSSLTLVAAHFDELISRLPDAQAFLSPQNLLWLGLLLAIVKVLHEFGHGMTCKRFGGECHELGVLLLVFTPTLYCDVSDMWMVPEKWKRIAVSLAGIWVEVLIAATCTWLWWFSAPGLFHSLCLNLMVLCGVNTLVFNGNPLLRYDGYFAFADALGIPNLRQQSVSCVKSRIARWFFRVDSTGIQDRPWQREWGLFAYGVAATVYRVLLSILILWGLYRWMSPLGMGPLVHCLAFVTMGSMVVPLVMQGNRILRTSEDRKRVRWGRVIAAAGLIAVIGFCPLPSRVSAEALTDDDDARRVYVTRSGTLLDSVKIGQQVEAGQVIARLDEPGLRMKLIQQEGELNLQRSRLEYLERRRISEPQVAQHIPTVREIVRDLEQQLAQLQRDSERLVLRSVNKGTVLPSPRQRPLTDGSSLPPWSGQPLDEQNKGSYLREGTVICLVGDPECQSASVLISQDDVNLVRVGQHVRFAWNELKGEVLHGEIIELSGLDLTKLPRWASSRLNLPVRFAANRGMNPIGTWYQARVKLSATDAVLLRNSTGQAKILVDPQSLFSRLARWLKQTFSV